LRRCRIRFNVGMTVHTGRVVVGQMGHFRDRHLKAIGDAVNLVSRLEGLDPVLGTGILVTQNVVDACPELPDLGRRFSLNVRGRSAPVTASELLERPAE